jgi:transposase
MINLEHGGARVFDELAVLALDTSRSSVFLSITSGFKEAQMEQNRFYEKMLKLTYPWHVERVAYDGENERVDIYIEHDTGFKFFCPDCGEPCPTYDHTGDKQWRHLNTCQAQTWVHARLPRTDCKQCGVKLAFPPLGD